MAKKMVASLISPTHETYGVTLMFKQEDRPQRQDCNMPSIYIPCDSYDHARAVCNAYNHPVVKEELKTLDELMLEDSWVLYNPISDSYKGYGEWVSDPKLACHCPTNKGISSMGYTWVKYPDAVAAYNKKVGL